MMVGPRTLAGRLVLVVEDDYFQAAETCRACAVAGAEVLGPVGWLDEALTLAQGAEPIDGAILDINLHDQMVFPVADALHERGVPFVFVTGYDRAVIPSRFADVPQCEKPTEPGKVAQLLISQSW